MQIVITVVGSDKVGILAKIATICAEAGANVEEVTQTILRGTFAMIMLASLPNTGIAFNEFAAGLRSGGTALGVEVTVTRQDTFDAMHNIG